jgi:hypothetical protein
VESNQCLTFFAPAIASLWKKAKFVHLVRHPGDFVRSAVRKGWHKNDSIWESGRVKMVDQDLWARLDHMEKLGWLWNTTNQFVEDFFRQIENERTALFKIEDLFQDIDTVKALFRFIGTETITEEQILEIQCARINEMEIHPDEPPNMKKMWDFPLYNDWNDKMKKRLKIYAEKLGLTYNYDL